MARAATFVLRLTLPSPPPAPAPATPWPGRALRGLRAFACAEPCARGPSGLLLPAGSAPSRCSFRRLHGTGPSYRCTPHPHSLLRWHRPTPATSGHTLVHAITRSLPTSLPAKPSVGRTRTGLCLSESSTTIPRGLALCPHTVGAQRRCWMSNESHGASQCGSGGPRGPGCPRGLSHRALPRTGQLPQKDAPRYL